MNFVKRQRKCLVCCCTTNLRFLFIAGVSPCSCSNTPNNSTASMGASIAQKHTMMMGQITRADAVAACCNSTLRIITTPYYYVTERAGQPAKTEETIGAERNIIWHTGNVNSLRRMRDIRGNGGTRTLDCCCCRALRFSSSR